MRRAMNSIWKWINRRPEPCPDWTSPRYQGWTTISVDIAPLPRRQSGWNEPTAPLGLPLLTRGAEERSRRPRP